MRDTTAALLRELECGEIVDCDDETRRKWDELH